MAETAGYSSRPTLAKLGYEPGDSLLLHQAPETFRRLVKEGHVDIVDHTPSTWAHGFFRQNKDLESWLDSLELKDINKGLWLSWPKKSSDLSSEVNEDTLRSLLLPLGWVDTKVCAIDDTWSGLKFLRRRQ